MIFPGSENLRTVPILAPFGCRDPIPPICFPPRTKTMKMPRPFLKLARKKKQHLAGKSRKPSLLAGSIALLAASAFSLTIAPSAEAAIVYWDINGTTAGASNTGTAAGTWDGPPTGVNAFWNSASDGAGAVSLWSDGDVAVFSAGGNATQAFTIAVSGTVKIGGLTFEEGLVTLSGGTLQMTVNSNFDVASGITAIVNSTVDGAFDLTKTGAGTLVLGGTNTYTGRTLISGGTLSISTDANLGTAPGLTADSISFTGSSTLQFTGTGNPTINSNRGITIGNTFTGTVQVVASANTVAYGGIITGAAGTTFTKTGAGTLDLSGNSTASFLGALNVDGGTLKLSGNGQMAGTSGVTIGNRGTLTLDNTATNLGDRIANGITSTGGTLNFTHAGAAATNYAESVGALALNPGALTINGSQAAVGQTSAVTLASITRVAGGTLLYSGTGAGVDTRNQLLLTSIAGLPASGVLIPWAIVNDGTGTSFAQHTGAGTTLKRYAGTVNTGAPSTWVAADNARPAATAGTNNVAKSVNTITFDNGIDLSGTAVTALTADRIITMSGAGGGAILQTGGTSSVTANGASTYQFAFGANEALFHILGTLDIATGSTLDTNLTGTGGLTKTGAGTLIIRGTSTITGTTRVNEGILEGRVATSFGTTQPMQLNGGTLRLSADAATTFTPTITVNADSTIQVDRVTAAATATTHTVGTLSIGGGRVLSVNSNDITSGTAYGLTTGVLTLTGAATIDVANNGAGIGTMTVAAPTGAFTLTKTGAGDLVTNSITTGFSGAVDIQAGRIGWSGASGTITEGQVFSGAGGIIKSGAGVVNLTAASTFTGPVTVTAGTLGLSGSWAGGGAITVSGTGVLSETSTGVIGGAASFTYSSSGASSLAGANTVTGATNISAGTVGLSGSLAAGGAITISGTGVLTETATGVISGVASITHSSSGTSSLAGANTFTGGITLSAGILGFTSASNNGGGPSALGQGTDGITFSGASTLSFTGSTTQSTNRAINATAAAPTFNNSSTGGGTITYAGAITAAGNTVTLTAAGVSNVGSFTGGFTQTGTAADLSINSGTWNLSGTNTFADDVINTGPLVVLNLNATGTLAYPAGASNGLYARTGATINLNANDVNGVANSGSLDFIILGDTVGTSTLNTNTFSMTTPRLDVGQITSGFIGAVTGTGTLTVTTSINLFEGSVAANLAGAGAIIKQAAGVLTLSGDNSGLTGATAARIDLGTVILDYTTSNTDKLRALTGLDMRGSTLVLNGNASATTIQSVASLTLASGGANRIDVNNGSGQSITFNVGAITRAAGQGTIRFELPATGFITTTTANNNATSMGILGGYATVTDGSGNTFFARNDGSGPPGNLVAAVTTTQNDVSLWVTGDNVTDTGSGYTGTIAVGDCININSLRFNAAGPSTVTVGAGGVLAINSGGVLVTSNVTAGAPSIVGGRLSSGTQELTFTHDGTQTLNVATAISGTNAITKTGTGTVALTGVNNSTGAVTIQTGTLSASGNGIGDTAAVTLSTIQASTLQITGNETIGSLAGGSSTAPLILGTVAIGGNTLTVGNAASTTYAGIFTGTGTIVKNGTGNLNLTGVSGSGYTGSAIVNNGLFQLSVSATMDLANVTINKGGAFLLDKNGSTGTIGTAVPDSMTVTLNSADGTYSGTTVVRGLNIRRDQGSTMNETVGAITLNSGASYATLDTSIAAGITAIITDNIIRTPGNNATFDVRGSAMSATANARGQLRIGTAGNQTTFIGTMIGGGGALGTKTISIVPWAIAQETATAVAITDTVMGNSLASYVSGQGFRALDLVTEYNTFATKASNNDNIRESLTANLTGLAGTTLNGLVLNNNTVAATAINVTGTGAGQTLAITSGALLFTLNSAAVAGNYGLTLGGFDSGITVGGTNEYVIHVVNPDTATPTKALSATISSPLTSTADITKSGRGTLILSGTNTAGGNTMKTVINEGTLQIADLDNIGGNTGGLVFAGGTLQLGPTFNVGTDDVSGRTITYLQGGGTIDTNGLSPTFAGSLGSGSGTFTKAGAGNLTLGATTAHTGATVISAGTVTLGAAQAIGTGALTVSGATTVLAMGANTATVAGLTMTTAGVSITGGGTLTVNGDATINNTSSIAPILAGTMNLLNPGGGALTLSNAANTFTGYTHVLSGVVSVLNVANAGSSSGLGAPAAGDNAAIRLGNAATAGTLLIAAAGTGGTTNRPIWLTGVTGGATIDNDSTAALIFNSDIMSVEGGAKTLTLQGTPAGFSNVLNGVIDQCVGTVALTKAEAGTWILANTAAPSTYTGINTITLGTLQVNRATGGLGDSTAVNAINLNAGTLALRNDGAGNNGSIIYGSASNPAGYNVQLTLTSTINVGNLTANTGNTIVLGPLTQPSAVARTLNVTGANGYTLTFPSFGLNPGTGQTTTLNPTTSSIIITGNVTNPMSGFSTAQFDTITLDGTSTGNSIGGVISDAAGGGFAPVLLGGYTRVTKSNISTWTIAGANTYTGVTTVSGGTLLVNNTTGSGTGISLLTVTGGTTPATQGTLGGTGIITGGVTLAIGTATTFAQGAALNPGTVGTAGTLTINTVGLTTNAAAFTKLNFDLNTPVTVGGGTNDLISTDVIPVIGATTQVNINALAPLTLGGLYTLANGYTGTLGTFGNLALNPVFAGDAAHSGVLQNNTNQLQLLVTNVTPSAAYWAGSIDPNWNTLGTGAISNWRTDATTNTDTFALPGATTDVHFYTTNPVVTNFATTLAQNFTIKTLTFDAAAASATSISGNTLTITPASSTTGITVDSGAGAVTINSNVALGAAQTWTNNATTLLTVVGSVTGPFGLTVAGTGDTTISGAVPAGITSLAKSGAGTLYLSNSNGFTATTTISGGVVKIDAESGLGVATNDVTFGTGGGTLQVTAGFVANAGKVINVQLGPGTIQVDAGTLVIGSAIVGTAAATANGGGLIKTGPGTLALTVSSSSYDAQGVGTGGAAGLAGFRVDGGTLSLRGTSTSVVGDINPVSMAVQLNGGNLEILTDTASIARANVYVTGSPTTITVDRATPGNGIAQNIGTSTGNGLTMGTGSSVLNIAGGANITGTTEAVSFTGTALFMVSPTFNVTNATGGGLVTLTLGAISDNAVARTITKEGNGTMILATAATSLVDGTVIDINGGTLNSNLAAALGTLAAVDVGDGTTFGVGATQQIGSLSNAGTALNNGIVNMPGAFTLTVGNATNNLSSTFTGAITGATGALAKAGSGTLTLSGLSSTAASNYGGLTTISAGTLVLNAGNVSLTGGLTLGAVATTVPVALDIDGINATFGGALIMNINSATASTITVDATKTLTVNNNVQIGATTPAVALTVTNLTINGGGIFNVTTAAAGTFTVGGSTSTTIAQDTTLDLTGLAATTINTSTTGTFRVNPSGGTNLTGARATLLLPTPAVSDATVVTTITAGTFSVGNASLFNSNAGQVNSVILGTGLTTLNADTVNVGTGNRDIGVLTFANANGDIIIRAADGASRSALNIGTGGATTGTTNPASNTLVDFTGHDANLLLTSLNVGNQARTGSLMSEFKFGAGNASIASTLDATSVNIGFRTGSASATNTLTDNVDISGGTVTFGNVGATGTGVDIGNSSYTGAGVANTIGTLNISGGTVTIYNSTTLGAAIRLGTNSVTGGGLVTASLNLTGGTITVGGHIIRNATSPGTTSTMLLDGATTLLDMGGFNIGSAASVITFDPRAGTLRNLGGLDGGVGTFTKTTSGTLTLDGTTVYTNPTDIQGGTIIADGTVNNRMGTGSLTMGNGSASAVLQLGGVSGASNQTVSSLATSGTGTTNAIVGGNASYSTLTVNQSTNTQFEGNIGGTGTNQNNLNVAKSGAGILVVSGTGSGAWTGTTNVSGGKLYIDTTGAFAANTVSLTVGDGAEFAARGTGLVANDVHGFGASAGNKITVGSGAGTAILGFRVDGTFNTQLKLLTGQTMTVTAGSIFQTAVYVDDAPTAGLGYVLIDGADNLSLHAGGGTFDFNPVVFNGGSFTYALSNVTLGGTVDRWVLTPTAQPALGDVWWRGDLTGLAQGVWSATLTSGTGFPSNWDNIQTSATAVDALVPPDSGSIVHFSSDAAANFATTLGANLTIQELIFHSGATAISVDGNSGLFTLTLGNGTDPSGITLLSGAQSVSFTADVAIAQAQSFNVSGTGGGTLTFSRGISGTGPLSINSNGSSTGTMILSGVNGLATYTGATNLVTGRLILEGGASNRLPVTTALTMGNATLGAVLQLGDATNGPGNTGIGSLDSGAATTNSIVGGNPTVSILTVNQTATGTFNGVIGGAGTNENSLALVKSGPALLTLNGANTFTGTATVTNGTLKLGAAGSIASSLIITASAGVTATFDNNSRPTVLAGGITMGGLDTAATPVVANTGGTGSITLGGNVTYDGTNNPLGGSIAAPLNLGTASRTFTANDSATAAADLTISGAVSSTAGSVGANGIGLTLDGTGSGFITGAISLANGTTDGTGADINKNGTGTWTVQNTAILGDNYNINAGTFTVSGSGSLTWSATGSADQDFVGDTGAPIVNFNVANSIVGNGNTNRIFGRDGSTINLNATGAIGSSIEQIILGDDNQGIGNLVLAGGTTNSVGRLDVGFNSVGEVGNVTGAGTLTVTTNINLNNGTVSGNLDGAGAILKNQPQTVTVSGTNSLTGTTTVQQGTLTLDYATTPGTSNKIGTGNFTIGSPTHSELTAVMNVAGHATTASRQNVANFSVAGGPSQISLTGTTGVDNILRITGTLARTAGTVNFTLANANTKLEYSGATANTNGTLPAWMILNRSNFATISENGAVDNIVAATYTTQNNPALWTTNQNITNSAGFSGTLDPECNTINTLRFNAAAASTVTVGAGNVLIVSSGGIMATSAVGANASTITGGNLFSGVGELFFHQENTASTLTVASTILGGAAITKTGAGTLVLSGTNNSTGNVAIEEGIIRLSGGSALSDTSDVSIFNNGGTANTGIELAASQTETIGDLIANTTAAAVILNTGSTLTVTQGSAQTMAGVISGAGTFVKAGGSTLTLTGTSTMTGTLRIDDGQILLSGANSQLAAITALILNGPAASIQNNQDQTASVNRINTATVLLNNTAGGTGFAISKNASTTSGTDAVGALTLGAGHNVITATSAIAATVGQWTFASLAARNNRATALVRGLGLGDSVVTQRGQIVFTAAPSGANIAVGGGGAAASQNISIFPWLVGDASATGLGNSFVMNTGTTNGLRPLTAAEYTTDAAGFNALPAATLSNNNLRFTTGAALTGTATGVNSLVIDAATAQTVTGPANTFEITSGAILAASTGTTITHALGGFTAITTGGARDYTTYVTSATGTLTISSPLTSTVPLVKSGAGTLSLTAAGTGNQFSDIYLNQGFVLADDLDRLGTGTLRFYGGGLKLAAAWTDDPSAKLWDINTGGGVLDVSLVTAGVTLANGIDDTTVSATDTLNIVTRSVTTGTTGLLTIQGASTYTGTTIINQSVNSATVSSVVLNGTTNAAINGNLQIGNVASGTNDVVVALGADEQIVNTATLSFVSVSGGEAYFKLFGRTETVAGISAVSRGVIENHESATDTVAGNGTLIVNSSQDFSYTGFLRDRASGTGGTLAFTKQGTGTQTLVGANVIYTGPTTISGGTLQLTDATAFVSNITDNANLTLNRTSGVQTLASIISGTGSVTKVGAGTVTLSGATSSYSGVTNIQQGILSISASNNIGDGSATNDILIANVATLQSTGASVDLGSARGIALAGAGGNIAVTGANLLTFGGVISGDDCSPLFKTDTGTLILTGTSIYTGATTISAGTLQIGNGGTTGLLNPLSAIVNSATLAFNRSNTWTFANSISGTGALNQIGTSTGRTVLTGTNTYTGITTVTSGTLQFGNLLSFYNNTPAQWTATNLVVQSGATAAFNVGGAGEFTASDIDIVKLIGTAGGGFRNGSVIGFDTTNAGGSFAYGTAIADTNAGANIVGVTKLGTGILTLNGSAANTYRGLTTVSAGTLDLGKPAGTNAIAGDALPVSKTVDDVLVNGGTLRLQANNQMGDGVRVHLTSGAFSVNGKTETIFDLEVNGGTFTTGAGAVFTVTDPTWTGGTNTISADSTANFGVLNISGGTNAVEGAGAGTAGAVLNIGSSGLNFSGAGSPNLTINSDAASQGKVVLSGNVTASHTGGTSSITSGGAAAVKGTLDLNGATRTFTVNDNASTLSVSAVIIGTAGSGLTKSGAGKMIVSSDSTFTGTTTVTGATATTGGILEVTGKLSGTTAVAVNNSGTLLLNNTTGGPAGVNDIIRGGTANLTVGTGGTAATVKMADSLSGNTQTFSNLTLSGNSTLDFGTGNANILSFTGTNNLAAYLSGGTLTIKGWSGTYYDLSETSDHGPASQDRLLFTSNPGFASNTEISGISFFDDSGAFIGNGLQISYSGGFEIVPVPEPATTALIGAVALCALIGYRERRRFTRACSRLARK
jgi:fibronectin-binding autotransporter adhesin